MSKEFELESFLKKISELLATTLCVDELNMEIDLATDLVNGVGNNSLPLSSIDYVEFLVMVETEYDVVYDFETTVYTIGDLYNYIVNYNGGDFAHGT